MKIALPVARGRVSPVLDSAATLLVLSCKDGREVGRVEVKLEPGPPEAMARALADLKLDLLLCGAVSAALLQAMEHLGIRVRPHLCGDIGTILDAFCQGQLARPELRIPGCTEPHQPEVDMCSISALVHPEKTRAGGSRRRVPARRR